MPPIEKIYEAYTAIADRRINMKEEYAYVLSSNGKKMYTVTWSNNIYASNDNATYWNGYAGYPIISVLMIQKKLILDREIASYFSGIDWNCLNCKYKRNYSAAVDEVFKTRDLWKHSEKDIRLEVEKTYHQLKTLEIKIKRGSLRLLK